jgi:hypothetical protein
MAVKILIVIFWVIRPILYSMAGTSSYVSGEPAVSIFRLEVISNFRMEAESTSEMLMIT